jgi:hypothetical protein
LLGDRSENEAYCIAEEGKRYGVYFPNEGSVTLDLTSAEGKWQLKWLNIAESVWLDQESVLEGGNKVQIITPGIGHCAALILPINHRVGA